MSVSIKYLRRGFSLLELMVVVAVISIMLTYALPNVLGTRQTEQLKSATDDVMNIFEYAKVRSANAFTAYGVKYSDTDGGLLQVVPGTGPNCSSVDFANGTVVKELHFQAPVSKGGPWNVKAGKMVEVEAVLPNSLTEVCFTPDGRFVRHSDSKPIPPTLETTTYQTGEFIVTLARYASGQPMGIRHHIIVSYSGRARFTFGAPYFTASENLDNSHTSTGGEGY